MPATIARFRADALRGIAAARLGRMRRAQASSKATRCPAATVNSPTVRMFFAAQRHIGAAVQRVRPGGSTQSLAVGDPCTHGTIEP